MISLTKEKTIEQLEKQLSYENLIINEELANEVFDLISKLDEEYDTQDYIDSYFDYLYDVCEHEDYDSNTDETWPRNDYDSTHEYTYYTCKYCGKTGHQNNEGDIEWE